MMTFNQNGQIYTATNSLKPVKIWSTGPKSWHVYTPAGRLLDDINIAGTFKSFEEAKRNAEEKVGMTIKKFNWSDS